MKTKERSVYLLIIISVISLSYYFVFFKDLEYIDIYKKQIEALDSKIDSLHSENKFLEQEVDSLNGAITFLDKEINEQDKLLDQLEKETNEKISSVDTLSVSDLTRFFTDRYRHVLRDSTK